MLSFIRQLMGKQPADLRSLISAGAVIVDVRTREEFSTGHAKGSKNIPVDSIESKAEMLKKYPHVIVCCRSGARSAYAMRILKSAGIENVTNAGSWQNVRAAAGKQ